MIEGHRRSRSIDGHGRSLNVMEGQGRSWKVTEGHGRSGLTSQGRKVMGVGWWVVVACRIILSAQVPDPFLWTLDLGFGTWI